MRIHKNLNWAGNACQVQALQLITKISKLRLRIKRFITLAPGDKICQFTFEMVEVNYGKWQE